MKPLRLIKLTVLVVIALVLVGYATINVWPHWFGGGTAAKGEIDATPTGSPVFSEKVSVSDQAQKNLGITARSLKAQTFWKSIQIPGMVVDRAGRSDRGVIAPTTGVVTRV